MMYDKPEASQQWSVHAEVTISHNDGSNVAPPGVTHTEQNGNGLRMVYTWTSHPPNNEPEHNNPSTSAFQSDTTSNKSGNHLFQRGGMTFTSVPPRQQNVQDSGYNSELLSPSSCGLSFRRPIIPYNRRCRSTCSIILSTAVNSDCQNLKCDTSAATQPAYHHCGRTQSLRCQTPSIKPDRRDSYYGCGDPWCYHADEFSNRRCSPVLESCEECSASNQSGISSKRASRANTFTTHFCTRVPERNRSSPPSFLDYRNKDMACQTVETREKCTSPFEKMEIKEKQTETVRRKNSRKLSDRRKSSLPNSRRNSDNNTLSPSTPPIETADNKKSSKRITRSPAVLRGRSPLIDKNSPVRETSKKQRTVHIDVYCTGSDCDSETDSSSDSGEDSQTSPQTVFESDKMRISHRRADNTEMPYSLRNLLKSNIGGTVQDEQRKKLAAKLRNSDSEEETTTAYPSALSSYSQIGDFESTAMSTSSCTVTDDFDSLTSCKDTVSDFESLVMKKFSLTPDESEYFIPRRLQSAKSSRSGVLPSESFDYEDAADRERILLMEKQWAGDQKTWKSPSSERKFLLQQQKIKEYLEKRTKEIENKPETKESETESTEDDSEQGWSFVRSTVALKREDTIKRASKEDKNAKPVPSDSSGKEQFPVQASSSCTLIGTQQTNLPFTIVPGRHSDPLFKAQKFGAVVGAIRKPGHHVGPAKNPDCQCYHCKLYYEDSQARNRTRSVGDNSDLPFNWREKLKPRPPPSKRTFVSDF